MDYAALDVRSFFSIQEAAMAWCEITGVTPENEYQYRMIAGEIMAAIQSGELHARVPRSMITNLFTGDRCLKPHYDKSTIERNVLKLWALHRGYRPKFLYPEERILSEKEPSPRENQLNKARCQAVGRLVWKESPNFTIKDVIRDKRVLEYGGSYTEETLEAWMREIDPRDPERKIGRPKKVFETES